MGTAFRIFLIAVIIWYVIKYLLPAMLGTTKKENPPAGNAGKTQYRKSTRQGDVTITDYGERSKRVNPDKDEYVDYEEVD